jgi:hypothetical protein
MTRRAATRYGPCSSRAMSHGQPAGQEWLAYTPGDTYWRRSRGSLVCESSNGPRGYFIISDYPSQRYMQNL